MEFAERIELLQKKYETDVKPYLVEDPNQLTLAMAGMRDITYVLQTEGQKIGMLHNGLTALTASEVLTSQLEEQAESGVVPQSMAEIFEAYLNQMCLAIKSDNRF